MIQPDNNVWVFVEQRGGKPSDVSLELLSKGRKLADVMNGMLISVVIGSDVKNVSAESFRYGADESFLVDHPDLNNYTTLAYARILNALVDQHKPRVVLFGASVIGRDLAPRVASHTRSGLTADCTDLQVSNVSYLGKEFKDLLLQIRPAFGGNIIATIITPDTQTQMATVREGVMEMHPLTNPHEMKIVEIPFIPDDLDRLVTLVEQHREERKVNLKSAAIIVAGGYGMRTKESFKLIHELAHTIGGEVAGAGPQSMPDSFRMSGRSGRPESLCARSSILRLAFPVLSSIVPGCKRQKRSSLSIPILTPPFSRLHTTPS